MRTQTGTEGRPCEDTGRRRQLSTSQGEWPQKKPTRPTFDLRLPAARIVGKQILAVVSV